MLPLCSLWQATGIVDRNFHLGRQAGIEFGRAVWRYLTWDRILFQSVPWFRALRVATSMRIACSAACANTGCPPLTSTDFTVPSGATSASILTDPYRFMVRAISGYFGTTRFTTWRALSELSCWANEELEHRATAQNRTTNAAAARRLIKQVPTFSAY